MNSQTWFVARGSERWVAKLVRVGTHPNFAAGLTVAALVEAAGVPAGAPRPALDGRLAVTLGGSALALLTFVDGEELSGRREVQRRLIGATLAHVHRALAGHDVPGALRFHWLDPEAEHLELRAWLRSAIASALAAWELIPPDSLTWGLVHTDPAPEAFRLDPRTGVCGLIDWDRALVGPLLYDVASAVMYVGGPRRAEGLVREYLSGGPLTKEEVGDGLEPMLRFRWAVQADYFARRLATDDLTGIADPAENERGLEDARRGLARLAQNAHISRS
jgi:Ser/Thr protein kinase RdoA (MazF antagonist)